MIQIAAYRGKGWVSSAIKLVTYSQYSHIGLLFTEDLEVHVAGITHHIGAGNVIEAWSGGVRLSESLGASHTPGTLVDLFSFKTPLTRDQERIASQFLVGQLGKGYDYLNVIRFLPVVRIIMGPVRPLPLRERVFCSELGIETFNRCGRPLLERCEPCEVPPRDPPRSPALMFDRTVMTTNRRL